MAAILSVSELKMAFSLADFKPRSKPTTEELLRSTVSDVFIAKRTRSSSSRGTTTDNSKDTGGKEIGGKDRDIGSKDAKDTGGSLRHPKRIKPKLLPTKLLQWPQLPQKVTLSPQPTPKKGKALGTVGEMLKEKPTSKKSTMVHEEIIRSRDLVFEVYNDIAWLLGSGHSSD